VYDAFMSAFTAKVGDLRVGDPRQDVALGPLSSEQAAGKVVDQIDEAVEHGAKLIAGGHRLDRPGAFVEPTILTDVTSDMRAYREEIFGPVAVVHRATSIDDAVRLENDSPCS